MYQDGTKRRELGAATSGYGPKKREYNITRRNKNGCTMQKLVKLRRGKNSRGLGRGSTKNEQDMKIKMINKTIKANVGGPCDTYQDDHKSREWAGGGGRKKDASKKRNTNQHWPDLKNKGTQASKNKQTVGIMQP